MATAQVLHDDSAAVLETQTVMYRGASTLRPQQYEATLDEHAGKLILKDDDPNMDVEEIMISDIQRADAKDYVQGRGNVQHVLFFVFKDYCDETQASLEFRNREVRNQWIRIIGNRLHTGADHARPRMVESMLTPALASRGSISVDATQGQRDRAITEETTVERPPEETRKLAQITNIHLSKPEKGQLINIAVEIDGYKRRWAHFVINEQATDQTHCKKQVSRFIKEQLILPGEALSLYRYVRSVLQRAMMEAETQKVIDDINALNFDELMKTESEKLNDGDPRPSSEYIIELAEEELSSLSETIERRIGHHGAGAEIVGRILRRSMDKMKVINAVAAKIYDARKNQQNQEGAQPLLAEPHGEKQESELLPAIESGG
eukprot:TRINITY_DN62990_c0_g1_i1.p1 TRINITY_DN62990_c0_g1~~TRINITY_DN62990_c0_g1_i1.p1  ORF type:complete len:377 (-),score=52.52 TRINITY_DN62990_c0_g1_i1:41-1171(-)